MGDSRSVYDDGQLPWLEAVDDEDGPRPVSGRKMLAALLVVLAAAAIVAATFFWLARSNADRIAGAPELIRAEPGPYKIKPADPGGLDVTGESGTAFETSAGEDSDAQLDMSKIPETPIARPVPKPAPAPAAAATPPATTKPTVTAPVPAPTPAPPAGAAGSVIQLGAFKNAAQAERAWTSLSGRFPSIASMTKLVVPFSGGIRLRASAGTPAAARQACQALKIAGENCFVAN
ncbi:MAG: SPOR domain-containing protein [Sphingomicrobium sp.]